MNFAKRDDRPLVVVEKIKGALRITAVDQRASRLELTRGLTLADARARVPDLTVADADAKADARFIERLALLCDRFTPSVAFDLSDGLMLDITGCAHLFGGEAALRKLVVDRMNGIGLSIRASIASTPDAARALARFNRIDIAPQGQDEALVRRLPVAALSGLERETVVALSRAGLKTIGDLADRPSQVLAARFGQNLVTRLMRTLGRENARITPLRPVPAVVAERHFAEPLTQAATLEDVLATLIDDAVRGMQERDEGGRVFEASFFRSDGDVRRLTVQTGRPCRDAPLILRLYRERLDTLADPIDPGFGFDAIRLAVLVTETLKTMQPHLDGHGKEDDPVSDLVDRLIVRFGRDRVLRFEARDTYDPDRDAQLVSAADICAEGHRATMPRIAWPVPELGESPTRPLQLFDPPQPIEALAEVPDGPPLRFRWRRVLHEVTRAEGPERIAPEWWRKKSDEQERDYYRVEDEAGCRFWIFRQGHYGEGTTHPRWFLHGVFA
jgi:protein ImuB